MFESRRNLIDIEINTNIKMATHIMHNGVKNGLDGDVDADANVIFDVPWLTDNDNENLVAIKEKLKKFKSRKKRFNMNQDVVWKDVGVMNEDTRPKDVGAMNESNKVVCDTMVNEYDVDSDIKGILHHQKDKVVRLSMGGGARVV